MVVINTDINKIHKIYNNIHKIDDNIPLLSVNFSGEIINTLGNFKIKQTYINKYNASINAAYDFNLDSSSVIIGYKMKIGERHLIGNVIEKSIKQSEYDDKSTDFLPNKLLLLEKISDTYYIVNIGIIESNKIIEIEIEYITELIILNNIFKFTLPINIVPKNNIPNTDLNNLKEIIYFTTTPYTFDCNIIFMSKNKIIDIYSRTHDIKIFNKINNQIEINCNSIESEDFNLFIETELNPSICHYYNEKQLLHYFGLNFQIQEKNNILNKEYIFVLDRFISMHDDKIIKSLKTLKLFIKLLNENSYFNVIFVGSCNCIFPNSIQASSINIELALYEITNYNTYIGYTDLIDCFKIVLDTQNDAKLEKIILLISDGHFLDINTLLELIKKYNYRIFTIGIGYDVNIELIEKIAINTYGQYKILDEENDINSCVENVLTNINKFFYKNTNIIFENNIIDTLYIIYPNEFKIIYFKMYDDKYKLFNINGINISNDKLLLNVNNNNLIEVSSIFEKYYLNNLINIYTKDYEFQNDYEIKNKIIKLSCDHKIMNNYTNYIIHDTTIHNLDSLQIKVSQYLEFDLRTYGTKSLGIVGTKFGTNTITPNIIKKPSFLSKIFCNLFSSNTKLMNFNVLLKKQNINGSYNYYKNGYQYFKFDSESELIDLAKVLNIKNNLLLNLLIYIKLNKDNIDDEINYKINLFNYLSKNHTDSLQLLNQLSFYVLEDFLL
jgi:Ca-activated chloride channel family protein